MKRISRHKQFGIPIPDELIDELAKAAKVIKAKTNVESIIDNGKIVRVKALGMKIPKQASKAISEPMEVNNVEVNMKEEGYTENSFGTIQRARSKFKSPADHERRRLRAELLGIMLKKSSTNIMESLMDYQVGSKGTSWEKCNEINRTTDQDGDQEGSRI